MKIFKTLVPLLTAVCLTVTPPSSVRACPLVDGFVDFNCDGEISVLATGDSITYGIGDDRHLSNTSGGYPERLQSKIAAIRVEKLAKPGATAENLRRLLHTRSWQKVLGHNFDYAIIMVGVNNYWEGASASAVLSNIKRIRKYLETFGILVSVATLTPNNRSFQKPFVDAVNYKIRRAYNPYVDFSSISPKALGDDGLHPEPRGYRQMADVAKSYIEGPLQEKATSLAPPT